MPNIELFEPEDPRKVYEALIQRCQNVKKYTIRCIVDESWTGQGTIRHSRIENGIYYFDVVAFTMREAMLRIVNEVPVLKFLDECDE